MSSSRKARSPVARTKKGERGKDPNLTGERLQKVIAAAGIASRRAAEELIAAGRVTVDGEVVTLQGRRVDPAKARIEVDGQRINVHPRHVYYAVNKPRGVLSTAADPQGRPTILDLIPSGRRVYPVGRLDGETMGLILLTDDGPLTHRLTHPRHQIRRAYLAEIRGVPARRSLAALTEGVHLEDGVARAVSARVRRRERTRTHLEIVMTEGRKHEVRRMLAAVGHPAVRLVRTGFGPIKLGDLPQGRYRPLTAHEIGALYEAVGL